MRKAIDTLLDAIDDAADGQEAWREHGPYRLILQRAKELRKLAQTEIGGLKESYEPGDGLGRKNPDGRFVGEAWIRNNELIIGADNGYDLADDHNCDANGCGAWHVLFRMPLTTELRTIREKLERGHDRAL